MRNAWCSGLLPSPKSRLLGSSLPVSSNSSSTILFLQSAVSSNSSREDVRYARSGARDSSCSTSSCSNGGQGQTWALAPGPQWREELSEHSQDRESPSVLTGPSSQGHALHTGHVVPDWDSGQGAEENGKGVIRRPRSGTAAWAHRKRQPKKQRMVSGVPSLNRRDDSSSSEGGDHRQGSLAKRADAKDRTWQSGEEFKAAIEMNRRIVATTSTEEVLSLVDEHWSVFNSVNTATAFHRLAKVWPRPSASEDVKLAFCCAGVGACAPWSAVHSS